MTAFGVVFTVIVMARTTYFTGAGERFVIHLTGAIICGVIVALAYKMDVPERVKSAACLMTTLTIANMTAIPMLYFTSGFSTEEVSGVASDTLNCLLLTCGGLVGGILLMYFMSTLNNRRLSSLSIVLTVVTLLLAFIVLLFSDRSSGTSIVFGVQVALPGLILMILCSAVATHVNRGRQFLCLGAASVLAGTIVFRNEMGVPTMFLAAMMVWYLFFAAKHDRILTTMCLMLPVVAAAGLLFFKKFGDEMSGVFVEKVMSRVFAEEVQHNVYSQRSLQQSGLFGSSNYIYMPEASSDFSLITIAHYLGLIYLSIVLIIVAVFFNTANAELINEKKPNTDITSTIAEMSLCMMTVIIIYNILMCLAGFPIIGVQMLFTGTSNMVSILSGFLLGCVCFSSSAVEKTRKKINEIGRELL